MPRQEGQIPVIRFPTVDSTSLEARRRLSRDGVIDGPMLLLADTQTGGVGRFGRRWESPMGGVWATLVWPLPPQESPILDGLGMRIGLACAMAIEDVVRSASSNRPVSLKWPNDVLIGGRKVLGVLTEIVRAPGGAAALIGIGVNANFPIGALPEPLRAGATTLADELGTPIEPANVIERLLPRLAAALRKTGLDRADLEAIRARLHGVGRQASIRCADGVTMHGALLGLSDDGRPRLDIDGRETLAPAGAEVFFDPNEHH